MVTSPLSNECRSLRARRSSFSLKGCLKGALALCVLLATPISAQQGPERAAGGSLDWEDPSGTNYSQWNSFRCLDFSAEQQLRADCLGDKSQEDFARQEMKNTERWVRAGLLFMGQLMAGIEFIKDTVQETKDLASNLVSLAKGFDVKRADVVAVRLARQTDNIDEMLGQTQSLMMMDSTGVRSTRYTDVENLVLKALNVSKGADLAAITLADQTTSMQIRLSGGSAVKLVDVGDGADGLVDAPLLPPLPSDAESTAPEGVAAPMVEGMRLVSMGGPSLVAVPARAGAAGATGATDYGACAVAEDKHSPDPLVAYQRAVVMATGAEAASVAPANDVQKTMEDIRAAGEREKQAERETWWAAFRQSLRF